MACDRVLGVPRATCDSRFRPPDSVVSRRADPGSQPNGLAGNGHAPRVWKGERILDGSSWVWVGVISVFLGSADPFLRPRQGNDVVRDTIAGGRQSGSLHFGKENGYSATRCGLGRRYSVFLRERRLFLFAGLAGGKTGFRSSAARRLNNGSHRQSWVLSRQGSGLSDRNPIQVLYRRGVGSHRRTARKWLLVDPGSGETLAEFLCDAAGRRGPGGSTR